MSVLTVPMVLRNSARALRLTLDRIDFAMVIFLLDSSRFCSEKRDSTRTDKRSFWGCRLLEGRENKWWKVVPVFKTVTDEASYQRF